MAEVADCSGVNAAKRKPLMVRKSRQSTQKKSSGSRVNLEKVLGISTSSSSGLTSDPNSGLVAYPAGCVIVLLHPKKNKQSHIINTSRKPFSALAFSHDGKHLVTGESGHMPCVRVWELDGSQAAEVQSHKYGVSCVAFSTNNSYIVSVGYQHDMTVSVWDWKKGAIIASNKVSSRVFAVSFSQDSSYFVTAGSRHVKFWYLDASKERRVNSTVPLIGRSGLLGDHKNDVFCGVACGQGHMASNIYCITTSGRLCLFNGSRHLEAWVDLKTSSASCLAVSETFIFCGCSDGVVRVFSPTNLQYITTLQRPHRLGVDLTQSTQNGPGAQHPDTLALTFNAAARHLTCVYNDHSVYVWDVRDVRNAGKLYSALYHSGCVWSVEIYPDLADPSQACLPPSSFLTCSSDNTIRLWHTDPPTGHRNLYSNDLLRILYMGEDTQHLQPDVEKGEASGADGKTGIRVLGISPDGQHLAAGDRCGNLRIFGLKFLDELAKIEAHDSEVLCLEFSPMSTGVKLLASASRDRLIHVFNLEKNYSLEQTLNDHSASITAVKFTGENPEVRMVSCGADKSIYFQTAEQTADSFQFSRSHHVVEKTTLYDMDLDSSRTHVAIACQDRNVRVYNVGTGKLKRCLKGSSSDEGALLKVQMDSSGSYLATSCSDKNITIIDYESGECIATLFGHSEIVTCMRFSQDCRHLVTVSVDSCVFVWRLDSQMTATMRKRMGPRRTAAAGKIRKQPNIRRETFITVPAAQLLCVKEEEPEASVGTPDRLDAAPDTPLLQTNGKLPMWFRKLQGQGGPSSSNSTAVQSDAGPRQARCRWTEQLNPLTICSTFSPSSSRSQEEEEEDDFHPQSLDSLLEDEEEEEEEEDDDDDDEGVEDVEKHTVQMTAGDQSTFILYPNTTTDGEFNVEAVTDPRKSLTRLEVSGQGVEHTWNTQLSPDSACCDGSVGSLEQQQDADTDSLSQGSSVGSLGLEEDEDRNSLRNHVDTVASSLSEEKFDTDLRSLQPPEERAFLNPRFSISTRFLSRFQDRIRTLPSRAAPPPVSIPSRISEESNVSSSTSANSEQSLNVSSAGPTLRETSSSGVSDITSRTTSAPIVVSAPLQQGVPRLGYLATMTSSRAKVSQESSRSILEENKENICAPSENHPEPPTAAGLLPASAGPDTRTTGPDQNSSSQPLVTPTQTTSQVRTPRWSVSSTEDHNRTLLPSPAPLAPPSVSDINITPAAPTETRTRPETPESSSSNRLHPSQTGSGGDEDEESVSLQQCQHVANELRQTVRRAVQLYQQLGGSQCSLQKSSVLREAFNDVRSELEALVQSSDGWSDGAPSGLLDSDGTLALMEKYSELLVEMTRNKLNRI
ncbi:WD repeat-containing protein 62 isoform 2-T2 [Pholidichthys leucotaenia]